GFTMKFDGHGHHHILYITNGKPAHLRHIHLPFTSSQGKLGRLKEKFIHTLIANRDIGLNATEVDGKLKVSAPCNAAVELLECINFSNRVFFNGDKMQT